MRGLPVPKDQSSPSEGLERVEDILTDLMADGMTGPAIARRLAPGDRRKQKLIRRKARELMEKDPVQQAALKKAKAETFLASGMITQALIKRASRGRVDAAKFLFEFTGIHNPKVQHEHSGDVSLTLKVPRPEGRPDPPGLREEVIEAEAVEVMDGKGLQADSRKAKQKRKAKKS